MRRSRIGSVEGSCQQVDMENGYFKAGSCNRETFYSSCQKGCTKKSNKNLAFCKERRGSARTSDRFIQGIQ